MSDDRTQEFLRNIEQQEKLNMGFDAGYEPIDLEEKKSADDFVIIDKEDDKLKERFKGPDTKVSITIPKKSDFYRDDLDDKKAQEYRDIEKNTEPKLFKSKETLIKERKKEADSKYNKIRHERIEKAKGLYAYDEKTKNYTGTFADNAVSFSDMFEGMKSEYLGKSYEDKVIELHRYRVNLENFIKEPIDFGDISDDGRLLEMAAKAAELEVKINRFRLFLNIPGVTEELDHQLGDWSELKNQLNEKAQNFGVINQFLKSEVIRIGKGQRREMDSKEEGKTSYADILKLKNKGIIIKGAVSYHEEEEVRRSMLVFSKPLYSTCTGVKFNEKLTTEQREAEIKKVGSELNHKAIVAEQIKKNNKYILDERDFEASIRRKLSTAVKKEADFKMLRDLSVAANLLSEKHNNASGKYEKLVRDYSKKDAASRDDLLRNLEKKIMELDFSKMDISDDTAVAENLFYLENATKLIKTYNNILKDSKVVLGDKFKDRSKLYAETENKKRREDETRVENGALADKIETVKDITAYFRVKKMIITNPYYIKHRDDEISINADKTSDQDKLVLARLLRTANYLGKNLYKRTNLPLAYTDVNYEVSKEADPIEKGKELELRFVSADALDYQSEASNENSKTAYLKEKIKHLEEIKAESSANKNILSKDEFATYMLMCRKVEEAREAQLAAAGGKEENIPEEERIKSLPAGKEFVGLGNNTVTVIKNIYSKARHGKYHADTNKYYSEITDKILANMTDIKAALQGEFDRQIEEQKKAVAAEQAKIKNDCVKMDYRSKTDEIIEDLEKETKKYVRESCKIDLETIREKKYPKDAGAHAGISVTGQQVVYVESKMKRDVPGFKKRRETVQQIIGNVKSSIGIDSPTFKKTMTIAGDNWQRVMTALARCNDDLTDEELFEMVENMVFCRKIELSDNEEKNKEKGIDEKTVKLAEAMFVDGYYTYIENMNNVLSSELNALGDKLFLLHPMDALKLMNDENAINLANVSTSATNCSPYAPVHFLKLYSGKKTDHMDDFVDNTITISDVMFTIQPIANMIAGTQDRSRYGGADEEEAANIVQGEIQEVDKTIDKLKKDLGAKDISLEDKEALEKKLAETENKKKDLEKILEENNNNLYRYHMADSKEITDKDWNKEFSEKGQEEFENTVAEGYKETVGNVFICRMKVGYDTLKLRKPNISSTTPEQIKAYNEKLKKSGLKPYSEEFDAEDTEMNYIDRYALNITEDLYKDVKASKEQDALYEANLKEAQKKAEEAKKEEAKA